MRIESLHCENFRNLERVELELPARVNLFLGDNGSGKTSLLEAVHVALTGRSQRRATHEVMLRKGAEYFRLAVRLKLGKVAATIEYAFTPGRSRTLKVNNSPVRRLAELLENFAVVSFAPEDLQLVYGSPSDRRAAFDFVLCTASSAYLAALTGYQRAVQQKNRLLKDLQKNGRGADSESQLSSFNVQLIEFGVQLMKTRHHYLLDTDADTRDIYSQLSDHGESVAARYVPSVEGEVEQGLARAFEQKLAKHAERERVLGVSLVGPHRDEWIFSLGERPARQYASQGQARSLAVALKLAGFRYLERVRGDTPILLFDEIFGELDPGRGTRLLELVGSFAQALITSVQPQTADKLGMDALCFDIASGGVNKRA